MAEVYPTGTWLQIGANTLDPDGNKDEIFDPLQGFLPLFESYRKVFVEPVPSLFQKLEHNTRGMPNVHLVNAAIVDTNSTTGTIDFFCPPADHFNKWLKGICSLDERVVAKALPPGVPADRLAVPANSVEQLFEENNIQDVRVVMIDTEGFDVKILKMLPFGRPGFHPTLVVFEHTEVEDFERVEAGRFLHDHCYIVTSDLENSYGLRM